MSTVLFGQFVVGPPGSGKSTYCKFIKENLIQLGRNAHVINLDPANDNLPYKSAIDLMQLISVETVMKEGKIGPNGAMIHCIETLDENYDWLHDQIIALLESEEKKFGDAKSQHNEQSAVRQGQGKATMRSKPYLIFDCPGQSELFTHHRAMSSIIKKLTDRDQYFDLRLVCMNLCDAYHASDLGKYIGIVMNSLSTMLNLALPHINVLSKVDKIQSYGNTRFSLDFYCEVLDLKYLLATELESPFYAKYRKLTESIAEIIEDFSLVHFIPLDIQKAEDIYRVIQLADKANGYSVEDLDLSILQFNPQLMEMASGKRIPSLNDGTQL